MENARFAKRAVLAACLTAALATPAAGMDPADKCEAAKLKITGKYAFCRLKALSKAKTTGAPADFTRCNGLFDSKFALAEAKAEGACPTNFDSVATKGGIVADTARVSQALSGVRFVDNGDGTVTDFQTGLTWEKKDTSGGIHDKEDYYTWSSTGTAPDGTVFTTFLATLNNGTSDDGVTVSGCFAGHCDWRLPTIAELKTILLEPYPCSTIPCTDPIFGPAAGIDGIYLSSTSGADDPNIVWTVGFFTGLFGEVLKTQSWRVRAVRGGP